MTTRRINKLVNTQQISYANCTKSPQKMTYRVVKFMVKVKLIEKSVNSHVGKVIVAKAINQYR